MSEAKEKAKELFDKYQIAGSQWYVDTTKKYALIAVEEILNNGFHFTDESEFWFEVKKELDKL